MKKWLPFILIAGTAAFTLSVYDQLPARIVTHWGTNGPNGWSSRELAAWFGPALAAFLWIVMSLVPRIDPRRANYANFQGSYDSLVLLVVAFACAVHVAVLGFALGWPIDIGQVVPALVGLLFLYIGYMLPRAQSNFFVGIRTPWTLSSDEVWKKTHRLAGGLFALTGLLIMSLAVIRDRTMVYGVIIAAGLLAFIPVPYSYLVWRAQKH